MKTIKIQILSIIILVLSTISGTKTFAQQTVWLVCTVDTSSIYKLKDGKEKFERRFYVTEPIAMSRGDFLKIDGSGDRIEGACADYFDKTVGKAAEERGEKLDAGGTLKVIRNIEQSGNNVGQGDFYRFGSKDDVVKKRDEAVKEMEDANRLIMAFNWDPTYKSEAADYAKETKRVPGGIAAVSEPKTEPKTNTTTAAPNPGTTVNPSYIFGWARVMTKVQDTSKSFDKSFDRAYYTNVVAFMPNADQSALKQQVATYFNQTAIPNASKVDEKVQIKDVTFKTFSTLVEADNARYAAASNDKNTLNTNVQSETMPIAYLNWNYYGGRGTLFDKISEFSVSSSEQWRYVVFEVKAEKMVKGQKVVETRYYVSYPFELITDGREAVYHQKFLDSYFTKTVVDPAKQKGIDLSYYDDQVKIMPASYTYTTFAEAWEKRNEDLETIKFNGYPQYDFLVQTSGTNLGEKVSFPYCVSGCTGERARVTASK